MPSSSTTHTKSATALNSISTRRLGRLNLDENAPQATGGDQDIALTVAVHGGKGTVRQGVVRHLVVRFEVPDGMHIYGPRVPDGMIATTVTIAGPEGFVVMPPELPSDRKVNAARRCRVKRLAWHGRPRLSILRNGRTGQRVSAPGPMPSIDIKGIGALPGLHGPRMSAAQERKTLTLSLDLDVIDMPAIDMHTGHGQREGNYDGTAMRSNGCWRGKSNNILWVYRYFWGKPFGCKWVLC